MEECFICSVGSDKVFLFDAVVEDGIVKVCRKCAEDEHIPIIRKPTSFQLKESEKKDFVYQGYNREKDLIKKHKEQGLKNELKGQEISLKEIVDKKYKEKYSKHNVEEKKPQFDLIDNFHWSIMRARRKKHITQEQLGKDIGEAEITIKMAEKGELPEDYVVLINKFESFFGIDLWKSDAVEKRLQSRSPSRILDFDPVSVKNLTIADLRKIKEREKINQVENGFSGRDVALKELSDSRIKYNKKEDKVEKEKKEIKENKSDVNNISQEEIDKIIFGK